MKDNIMYQYIKECEEEYKDLFGIEHFPEYEIKYKELGLEKAEQQGYDSFATAFYDIPTGRHTLEIWSKLYTLKTAGKAVVFHELTHIYDDDAFVGNDKMRYLGNHAYEEYHASQVELMKLLRVKDLDGTITFSMQDKIDTVTGTNVCTQSQRLNNCRNDVCRRLSTHSDARRSKMAQHVLVKKL